MFVITNTMTGKKEEFKSLHPGKVALYVCGITPYDSAHIGHGRCYVSFDILYRTLEFLGYSVTYCRNYTDIDDKLLARAQAVLGDMMRYGEIADDCIVRFKKNMTALNCVSPAVEPHVTHNIDKIISFIEQLIQKGFAYQSEGDVYFAVRSFADYPKLSKHTIEDLVAGSRVDINEKKRDPLDFALWKSEKKGTFWNSPFGWGRPGWHIECSALAQAYLGDQIDIHGGGMDLIFPHHDNEIAQSEAALGKTFAQYWVHNGFVRIEKEKMSKSLGNFLTLDDIFTQYDPMVLRYYFLNHHYRGPMDFSFDDMQAFGRSYQKLCRLFAPYSLADQFTLQSAREVPVLNRMIDFLCDDLNTVGLLGALFEGLDELEKNPEHMRRAKSFLHTLLGLSLVLVEKVVEITPEIQALLDARERARQEKDWARADQIRDQLVALGVAPQDKKAG